MDNFEKQQTIEAVKMVIKARWFYVLTIVLQGAVIKIWFPSVPLPTSFLIFLVNLRKISDCDSERGT